MRKRARARLRRDGRGSRRARGGKRSPVISPAVSARLRGAGKGRREEVLTSGTGLSAEAAGAGRWAGVRDRERSGSAGRTGPRGAGQAGERAGQVARARGKAVGKSGPRGERAVAGFGWAEWGRESWFGPRGKWAGGEGWTGLRWVWAGGLGFPNGLVWVSRFGFWVSFHTSSILILTQLKPKEFK